MEKSNSAEVKMKVIENGFTLIGIKTRTSNQDEMNGAARIGSLWGQFYADNISEKIPNKLNGEIVGVYHDYESDSSGAYSVMVGVKVAQGTSAPNGLEVIHIPMQTYQLFDCDLGPMPDVVIQTWKTVWALEENRELRRRYSFDMEVYPENPETKAKILIAI